MIEIRNCSKAFGEIHAIDHVLMEIGERQIFGLVGTNGAGKSTLLRMAAGVIKPDEGEILVDQEPVYENEKIKQQIFYISDGGYFPQGYTAADLKDFYREYYPDFMTDRYSKLMDQFHLDEKRRISSYSKGMKKQLLVIMGISAGTKYLLCDETFDGLDPVMRQAVKSLFVSEIMNRDFTPVIASHNMRELEDVCDHVGFLHKGGILLSRELEDMKFHIHKIQCVLADFLHIRRITDIKHRDLYPVCNAIFIGIHTDSKKQVITVKMQVFRKAGNFQLAKDLRILRIGKVYGE